MRIVRLLKPLSQIGIFADLETIFDAIGSSLKPMATVLLFIWFVLILFGIMGIALYGQSSFRRRCVWADTLEVKLPEQWCKRNEKWHEYPDCISMFNNETFCVPNPLRGADRVGTRAGGERMWSGLDNSCGPFQLCLDTVNPNEGFTSFDHLPSALVTLFQVMSGDG
ncbi:MAG: ion transporter, partial [bacterium]